MADTSNIALDQTINSAFSSNLASLEESWKRLSAGGVDGSTMLSAALREAMALLQYCCANEQGAGGFSSPEQRYSRGFGRTPLTSENLRKWSLDRACHAIEVLNTATLRARLEPTLSQELAFRALWTIAFSIKS